MLKTASRGNSSGKITPTPKLKASPLIFFFGLVAIITIISRLGLREINARAYWLLFNFTGTVQQKKVGVLSGGEQNRVHLARKSKG